VLRHNCGRLAPEHHCEPMISARVAAPLSVVEWPSAPVRLGSSEPPQQQQQPQPPQQRRRPASPPAPRGPPSLPGEPPPAAQAIYELVARALIGLAAANRDTAEPSLQEGMARAMRVSSRVVTHALQDAVDDARAGRPLEQHMRDLEALSQVRPPRAETTLFSVHSHQMVTPTRISRILLVLTLHPCTYPSSLLCGVLCGVFMSTGNRRIEEQRGRANNRGDSRACSSDAPASSRAAPRCG